MFIVCWSPKGGSGTTVVAAVLALALARRAPTVLVDLGGDQPGALGVAEPAGPGVGEWWDAPHAANGALARLGTPVAERLRLVHAGSPLPDRLDGSGWRRLVGGCALQPPGGHVVLDAARHVPDAALPSEVDHSLLVTRGCYLALRRAALVSACASGAVLVVEPGRALGGRDVEQAVGRPVLGQVPWDPNVARAVEAGLLSGRLPASASRAVRSLTAQLVTR